MKGLALAAAVSHRSHRAARAVGFSNVLRVESPDPTAEVVNPTGGTKHWKSDANAATRSTTVKSAQRRDGTDKVGRSLRLWNTQQAADK